MSCPSQRKRARAPRPLEPGDAVRAKFKADKAPPRFMTAWESQGWWFPGMVAGVHADGAVDVMFNDGFFEQRVLPGNVTRAGHRVLRQWRTAGHYLIGARLHGACAVTGTVVCWCPASTPDCPAEWPEQFHVVQDDDDEEMLTKAVVEDGIERLREASLAASSPTAAASRAVPPSVQGAAASTAANATIPTALSAVPSSSSDATTGARTSGYDYRGPDGVREVLQRLRLGQYADSLIEQGYDDLLHLKELVHGGSDDFDGMVACVHMKPGHALKMRCWLPDMAAGVLDAILD